MLRNSSFPLLILKLLSIFQFIKMDYVGAAAMVRTHEQNLKKPLNNSIALFWGMAFCGIFNIFLTDIVGIQGTVPMATLHKAGHEQWSRRLGNVRGFLKQKGSKIDGARKACSTNLLYEFGFSVVQKQCHVLADKCFQISVKSKSISISL